MSSGDGVGPRPKRLNVHPKEEGIETNVGPVEASWPSGGILKENPSSTFKEFDMLKLRYMYQILPSTEIYALHPHERVNWDVLG